MSNVPNDPIDPAELELARRVGAFSEQAVQPFDAGEIAHLVAVGPRRRTVAGRLLGASNPSRGFILIGIAALVGVIAVGAAIGAGGRGLLTPAQSPTPAAATIRACTPDDGDAVITAWDGAAGHRIATVELHQIGSTPCAIDPLPQPWLADGGGTPLITGKSGAGAAITIAPGDVLHTLVQVGNYCGPEPAAPVTVAFTDHDATFVATALSRTDVSGVPPCNGTAGPKDDIQMQPWSR